MNTIVRASLLAACCISFAARAESSNRNDPATVLNRVLAVLQVQPDSVGDACLEALKELHKTQKIVSDDEADSNNQDAAVARDVLESNYEDANEVCGADARTMCRTKQGEMPSLPPLCAAMSARRDTSAE